MFIALVVMFISLNTNTFSNEKVTEINCWNPILF